MSFSVQIRGEGNQTPRPSSFLVSYSFPQTRREWLQERLQSGITYTGVFAELRKPFWENAGGGGSNPHGAFAPEDFKSFDYSEKAFVLLALFQSNVKVCKFLCKY